MPDRPVVVKQEVKQEQLPKVQKTIGKRSGRSGKSGWKSWRERQDLRKNLEEDKSRVEVVRLRAKVEAAASDSIVPQAPAGSPDVEAAASGSIVYQAPTGLPDPWPQADHEPIPLASLAAPVESCTVRDSEVQAVADKKDVDCQTPDWRHPRSYLYGLQVITTRPHYINGVAPTDAGTG
ncbi:unnamed protein product [Symbiodinium sp. CCMP2592]|nr:unnamed protein product [Symbiodinium sp. CCMP2592]